MRTLRKSLKKYAFGQLLSLILATTLLINQCMSEKRSLNIPALQAALTYTMILVGSVSYQYFSLVLHRKDPNNLATTSLVELMRKNSLIMLGAVLFDVAANWLIVKAFSKLDLPEIMIFSGLSTPAAIGIAFVWNTPRPKYTLMQIMGVLMAFTAIVCYFFASGIMTSGSILGITLAISSAIAYAASNFFQEKVARVMGPNEFLIGLGSIGSFVSWLITLGSQEEFQDLFKSISVDSRIIVVIMLYSFVLSAFYLLIPVYMSKHSAVSFNFSLLTANFFAITGSSIFLGLNYTNWIYLSIILLNLGLLIYYFGEESQMDEKEIKSEIVNDPC